MWYPATVAAPTTEPVTLAQAKAQCRIEGADTDSDLVLNQLIAAARAHVEAYCGVRFAARDNVALLCDGFEELARLPEAPVASVASISYVDTDGASQTLASSVYELRADGIEAAIVLKYNQTWPAIRPGSRITVTGTIGAAPTASVFHAMVMLIAHWFENREAVNIGDSVTPMSMAVEALLSNHRRGL